MSADPTRSQIRGSSLLLGGQALAVVINLATQVLMVRYLSKESFGAFAYGLSIAMIAETVAAFGMRRGVSRFLPLYEERGQAAEAAGTLVLGITTVLGLGLSTVLVIIAFKGPIAGSFADDSTAVAVIVLLTLLAPIQALSTLLDGVFAVFGRPRSITMRKFILMPLSRLAVVGLLVASSQGIVFLAAGYVAAGALGIVLYAPLLVGVLRKHDLLRRLRPGEFKVPAREVLSFTVPLLTSDVTNVLLVAAGGVVLGLMATPDDVASLRAVFPIALTMAYVLSSFGLLLVPLASRLYARGDADELNRLYWRTAVWTAVLAYPVFIVCTGLAEPVTVLLFGPVYENAGPVLAALAVGQFINTASGHNGVLLGVFGEVWFIAVTNVVAILVNVALLLLLVPAEGALGAAIATSLTLVLLNGLRQWGLGRHTTVKAFDRSAALPYAAIAGASAVVVGAGLLRAPVAVDVALTAAAIVLVLGMARQRLELAESFPELARLPVLGWLAGVGRERGG